MDPGHHQQLRNLYIDHTGGVDRFPQWSIQETRDFLMIRAELDPNFMETKRNKILWEVISTQMKEKGYIRSGDQCKSKWKNLVTRYKGCETMEAEGMKQQFPYYNEVQMIFAARMQRMLWLEAESGGSGAAASGSKKKSVAALQLSSEEEDEYDDSTTDHQTGGAKKKRKIKGNPNPSPSMNTGIYNNSSSNNIVDGIKEVMEEFMNQHIQMEMRWLRAYETREEERKIKEMEWRQAMEALENEKIMMDKRWKEREEQRKIREEGRAEKRDTLITTLLNKLRREGHFM